MADAHGSVTSSVAALFINGEPVVTNQPVSVTINLNGIATFSAKATGASLAYQWQHNGANIVGKTLATLTVTGAQPTDAGSYVLQVTNTDGIRPGLHARYASPDGVQPSGH